MKQKTSKKNKRMWSVIVGIRVMGKSIVRGGSKKILRDCSYVVEYCFTRVTGIGKKDGFLYVTEGKKDYAYDINRVEMLQVREHKRSGIQ